MKKSNFLYGLGASTIVLGAAALVKVLFDRQHENDDLNDDEIAKISVTETQSKSEEDQDRGVAPLASDEDSADEISDLKADAINSAYQPVKY